MKWNELCFLDLQFYLPYIKNTGTLCPQRSWAVLYIECVNLCPATCMRPELHLITLVYEAPSKADKSQKRGPGQIWIPNAGHSHKVYCPACPRGLAVWDRVSLYSRGWPGNSPCRPAWPQTCIILLPQAPRDGWQCWHGASTCTFPSHFHLFLK